MPFTDKPHNPYFGGESGIRTHGTLQTYTRFPVLKCAKTLLISFYKFSLKLLQIKGFKKFRHYRLIRFYIVL
jgi:hypothetical protein